MRMSQVTLKVNVLMDGKMFPRGSVMDRSRLPPHLLTEENVVDGVVHINAILPVDMVELKELDGEEDIYATTSSPMKELEIPPPQKRLVRKAMR
jgi:hypothetical protein